MGHKDPVTPETRLAVFARDREAVFDTMTEMGLTALWLNDRVVATASYDHVPVCPAVVIDMGQYGLCWGRWTLDHIKSFPRFGPRAKSDMAHLIALCEGHTENGMKAGHQWNTANRRKIRKYLAERAWEME